MCNSEIVNAFVPTARSREIVCKLIVQLIRIASSKQRQVTYKELAQSINYRCWHLGQYLGYVYRIIDSLEIEGERVPTLNGLVVSSSTRLPNSGMELAINGYNDMTDEEKVEAVNNINIRAYEYKKWPEVLKQLNLK